MSGRDLLRFPNPVNETSARLVALGVVVQCAAFLALRRWLERDWLLLLPLVYGFVARVLAGPRLSPLGQLVIHVVTPRIPRDHRLVPGPPKRFAQGIGVGFSGGAFVASLIGADAVATVLIVGLLVAASLEAFLGVCLGCLAFNRLMRWGVIPESVCVACNDLRPMLANRAASTGR